MSTLAKKIKWFGALSMAALLIGALIVTPASAAVTWTGAAAPDVSWSSASIPNNWSSTPNLPLATDDIYFANAGTATAPTVTNEVTTSTSINSLWYGQQSDTPFAAHNTKIDAGQMLTITGSATGASITPSFLGLNGPYSLLAGNVGTTNTMNSQTAITGTGTLSVQNAGGDVLVAEVETTSLSAASANAVLDLQGLSTFTANIDQLLVGYNTNNVSGGNYERANGTLYLAQTNTITMNNPGSLTSATNGGLVIGYEQRSANKTSTVFLGQTNTLYTTTAEIGARRQKGTLTFNPAVIASNPTVKMRGLGSTDLIPVPVSLIAIGDNIDVNSGNQSDAVGLLDLTGGSPDILASSIILGRTSGTTAINSRGAQGTLTFNAGTINTTSMTVGLESGNWAVSTSIQGTVNVGGSGNLIVGSSGLTLAQNLGAAGTSTAPSGALNINGGTVSLGADITDGGGTGGGNSAISLAGGTLDMNGHNIGSAGSPIDILTLASGTLKNVAQINGGAAITKTTAGTLTIDGVNNYSGGTTVAVGKLLAEGSLLSFVTVNGGATLGGKGSVGGVTVLGGGTLSTGDSPGILTVNGNATLGGVDAVEINSASAGTGYDQLVVNGSTNTVSLAGTLALTVSPLYTPANDALWIVLNNTSTNLSGTFGTVTGLPDGWSVLYNVNYDPVTPNLTPGSGNDVAIVAIPEPAALLLLIIAAGLGLMFRRAGDK